MTPEPQGISQRHAELGSIIEVTHLKSEHDPDVDSYRLGQRGTVWAVTRSLRWGETCLDVGPIDEGDDWMTLFPDLGDDWKAV